MAIPSDPNFIILYVEDVTQSTAFYADLLGRPPTATSPAFSMFTLSSGVMLGLWARCDVQPAPMIAAGGVEICIPVSNTEAVDSLHAEWLGRGMTIMQKPAKMDFGHTFVAGDPDGHRLRVYAPAAS